jgi:hypothetical protein
MIFNPELQRTDNENFSETFPMVEAEIKGNGHFESLMKSQITSQ